MNVKNFIDEKFRRFHKFMDVSFGVLKSRACVYSTRNYYSLENPSDCYFWTNYAYGEFFLCYKGNNLVERVLRIYDNKQGEIIIEKVKSARRRELVFNEEVRDVIVSKINRVVLSENFFISQNLKN